jgi:hypothetical protein
VQDDGLHVVGVSRGSEGRHHGVGAGRASGDATRSAAPADDGAAHLHQADHRVLAAPHLPNAVPVDPGGVPGREEQLDVAVGSHLAAQPRVDLVPVPQPIDQPELERPRRRQRRPGDRVGHLPGIQPPPRGDAGAQVLHDGVGKPLCHLPVRIGDLLGGELVRGGLVLVALSELRLDAELVQPAP